MTVDARTFVDADDRKWKVVISYKQIQMVRGSDLDVDLAKLLGDEMAGLNRLMEDAVLFIDTMWLLVGGQYSDVEAAQFGEAMRGDGLENAQEAFMEALADFCPSRQGKVLRTLMAKTKELQEGVRKKVEETSVQEMISGAGELRSEPSSESDGTSGSSPSANLNGQRPLISDPSGTKSARSVQSLLK